MTDAPRHLLHIRYSNALRPSELHSVVLPKSLLNPLGINETHRIHKAALPYLKRDIGGDGWESVGEKVLQAKEYDGLIHLAPFTCMPETVAQNIMSSTKENIPVLTVLCDEQLAKPGMLTRLEAFVDLLKHKQKSATITSKD